MNATRTLLLLATLPLAGQAPKLVKATDVPWGPHPFLQGAFLAVQSGDPGGGPSVLLMRFPKGMTIPPHTHTATETVTLVSGSGLFGGGETVEAAKGMALGRGSFITIPGGAPHWAIAQEELVISVAMDRAADFHPCAAK
ncbi:MAG TPA: cupin domain-containing protein [Holophagaceae bacterium]|nr:cupin domain-containing protein [Holophagaceae bacterium]